MTITAFDRQNLGQLRAEINAAVVEIGKRHGVTFALGTMHFGAQEAHGKLTMTVTNPAVIPKPAATPIPKGGIGGLLPEDMLRVVTMAGTEYRIAGYEPGRRTRNIKLERVRDGKEFSCNAEGIAILLGRMTGGITRTTTGGGKGRYDEYPGDWGMGVNEKWDDYHARTEAMLNAIPRDKIIRFPVADGYALYYVVSTKPLHLQHIAYGDAYRVPAAHLRGLTVDDVEQMLARGGLKIFSRR